MRDVVSKVENLRIIDVADEAAVEQIADAAPLVELAATTDKGKVTYQLFRPKENGDFLVRASTRPQTFRLAAFTGEALDVSRDSLIAVPTPGTPETASTPAPDSAATSGGAE